MFDSRASLPNEVKADIEQFLNSARGTNSAWSRARVLPTFIRRNIKLAEAPSYGKTIFEYEQNCHGAEDYRKVAEFIHAQSQPPTQPGTSQAVVIGETQDQPDSPKPSSPQIQPVHTDENRDKPPIEIKTIRQPDSQAPAGFTRTTGEPNQLESGHAEG